MRVLLKISQELARMLEMGVLCYAGLSVRQDFKMLKMKNVALAAISVAALVACGGGTDPVLVAASDTDVSVAPAVAAALVNTPFAFPSGVAALGTTAATTVQFTSTATTPAFSISSGGNTATGTTTFGSCIFVVSNSTFPAGHPLANGQTVTVNPCTVSLKTSGGVANGQATSRSVAMLLGAAASANASVAVAVNAGGQIVLNGATVATITLTPISGT